MRDFKKVLGRAGRVTAFLTIMMILFVLLSAVTENRLMSDESLVPGRNKNLYGILQEQKDSIDILVLGDSLSYTSISPMSLWKEHGYTAFICGQPGQRIQETEDSLKMALKQQSPKLVILETNVMFRRKKGGKELNDSLMTLLNHYIPLFRGHDVWKSLIMEKNYKQKRYKGFVFRTVVDPYKKGNYMSETEEKKTMTDTVLSYMDHIIDECKNCGAELILLSTPSPHNYDYARHNTLLAYAKEKGLKYVDMNLQLEKTGIDWETDSFDKGDHMNLAGAMKVTSFLGEYLSENFSLKDHREDAAYLSWRKESEVFEKMVKKKLAKMRGEDI